MGYYISCPRFVIDDVSCLSDCGLVHEELLPDENDSSDKTSFNLPSVVQAVLPAASLFGRMCEMSVRT